MMGDTNSLKEVFKLMVFTPNQSEQQDFFVK
jgi:hypothetical protein